MRDVGQRRVRAMTRGPREFFFVRSGCTAILASLPSQPIHQAEPFKEPA